MASRTTRNANEGASSETWGTWHSGRDILVRRGVIRLLSIAALAGSAPAGCATGAAPDDATGESVAAVLDPDVPAAPGAAPRRPAHCVAPWGIDWSDVLHVDKAAMVSPFCTEVAAGDPFTPEVQWITNTEGGVADGPVLYPPGYTPRHKAPMNDFLHKLDSVRYVVQPGDLEFSFTASNIRRLVTVRDLYQGSDEFTPPQMAWPAAALLGELPPLPPGTYSADIHFVMSDAHCDGQHADFALSCLSPGDNFALTRDFVVVP